MVSSLNKLLMFILNISNKFQSKNILIALKSSSDIDMNFIKKTRLLNLLESFLEPR